MFQYTAAATHITQLRHWVGERAATNQKKTNNNTIEKQQKLPSLFLENKIIDVVRKNCSFYHSRTSRRPRIHIYYYYYYLYIRRQVVVVDLTTCQRCFDISCVLNSYMDFFFLPNSPLSHLYCDYTIRALVPGSHAYGGGRIQFLLFCVRIHFGIFNTLAECVYSFYFIRYHYLHSVLNYML